MGCNLSSTGDLTVSQAHHADQLGMKHEVFKQYVIDRLIEKKGGLPHTNRLDSQKKNKIKCKKACLVVGAGPSFKRDLEQIKKFKGIIVVVDINFNEVCKYGIKPDYVITLESGKPNVTQDMFSFHHLKEQKEKLKVVGSAITRDIITKYILSSGVPYLRFPMKEEPRASNVGIFSICFAYEWLKCDKIILIGFEHTGNKYPDHTYLTWQADFWYFIKQWPKETVVNCTDTGALYHNDYIIDTTLEKLQIETY